MTSPYNCWLILLEIFIFPSLFTIFTPSFAGLKKVILYIITYNEMFCSKNLGEKFVNMRIFL